MEDANGPRDGLGTLMGTGLEEPAEPLVEALRAVSELRAALVRGDADAVRPKLDLHAYGAGQRGLLSTLAGRTSVEEAVSRLAPFWRSAEYALSGARVVSPDEVEIYETITAPGRQAELRALTLLRRRGGHWRQVTTVDAPDEKLVASLICPDDPLLLRDEIPDARLRMDEEGATLAQVRHERESWVAVLRAGAPPDPSDVRDRRLREALDGAGWLVSVALLGARERQERERQLRWFTSVVATLGTMVGSSQAYLPWIDRLIAPSQLALPDGDGSLEALASRWVSVVEFDGWTGTRGMSHLMMSEVEARWIDWPTREAATDIVLRAAAALRSGECALRPRTVESVADTRCATDFGRRGPALGLTYGRFGAVRLAPSRP